MRKLGLWISLPLSAVIVSSCKPKEKPTTPEQPAASSAETSGTPATPGTTPAPAPATPTTPSTPAQPATPAISPAERAAKLGFARHLPADTQCMVSVHNPAQAVKRIKTSQLWSVLSEVADVPGMGNDEVLEGLENELDAEQEPAADPGIEIEEIDMPSGDPSKLLQREITLAFGPGTGKQSANLLTLNRRLSYHQMKGLATMVAKAAADGEIGNINPSDVFGEDLAKNLLTDKQAGTALFSMMNMPPIYAAFLSDPATRDNDTRDITNNLEMLSSMGEGMVTDVEVETAGAKFTGKKILGAKVAATIAEAGADAGDAIGKETFDKLVEEIAKKNLVILTGTVGDYFVLFLGSSEQECKIATSPADSLAANLSFADPYIAKDILAVVHGSKDLISTLVTSAGGLKDMADGLRDGIAGTTSLGNTRDIETLLQLVADKESDIKKLQIVDATDSIFYFEDGLKGESFGGLDYGAIDWNAENHMGDLAKTEGMFLFANLSTPAQFDKALAEYYEAILETGYTIALKVAEKGGDKPDLAQFTQGLKMFDSKFRVELVNVWKAFSVDMEDGLGRERAWIIDLKGSVPPIPGIPQPLVDKGKFPRITLVAPVADRAKLKSSWTKINDSATKMLAEASKLAGDPIPMQKPISSDKDGLTTWFFSMPFFNDDFMPSVTVGDKWFAASTSKVKAIDLINKAAESKSKSKGMVVKIDFKALQSYIKESMPVLAENATTIGMSENELNQFKRMPDAIQELDSLEINCRKENGTARTSIHFKTR